jgi:hypothetical protein
MLAGPGRLPVPSSAYPEGDEDMSSKITIMAGPSLFKVSPFAFFRTGLF